MDNMLTVSGPKPGFFWGGGGWWCRPGGNHISSYTGVYPMGHFLTRNSAETKWALFFTKISLNMDPISKISQFLKMGEKNL